jgi:hypothetical protein
MGSGQHRPLLVEETFGSYTLMRLGYLFLLLLIVPDGDIGEKNQRIAKTELRDYPLSLTATIKRTRPLPPTTSLLDPHTLAATASAPGSFHSQRHILIHVGVYVRRYISRIL